MTIFGNVLQVIRAAVLKSEGVLAMFSRNLKTP